MAVGLGTNACMRTQAAKAALAVTYHQSSFSSRWVLHLRAARIDLPSGSFKKASNAAALNGVAHSCRVFTCSGGGPERALPVPGVAAEPNGLGASPWPVASSWRPTVRSCLTRILCSHPHLTRASLPPASIWQHSGYSLSCFRFHSFRKSRSMGRQ